MGDLPPPRSPSGDDEGGPARGPSNGARDHPELPPVDVEIPDDLSELDDEIEALRRERRAAARRARWDRLLGTRRWRPEGVSGSLVVISLVVVGIFGVLLTVFSPRLGPGPSSTRRPLASPAQPPGTVGGLLPDVDVVSPSGPRPVRELRPALLALLPDPCGCAASVQDVVGQAHETRSIDTYLVAPGTGDPELAQLVTRPDAGAGRVVGLEDAGGDLARTYHADPAVPTLLLVNSGGRLVRPPRPFRPGDRLESWLDGLPPG